MELEDTPRPKRRMLTHDGKTYTLAELARSVGLSPKTLGSRLRRGMSVSEAISSRPLTTSESGRRAAKRSPWGKS